MISLGLMSVLIELEVSAVSNMVKQNLFAYPN